jgi:diguanylate cyclase (GGDEF)-like protein/putative nucleotidyltransferase with HDIG domain
MEQARDAGRATATARVRLVQETGDQWGFLVFQPIYRRGAPAETVGDRRENLEGFALGVFRAGDFVEAALEPLQRIAMDVCVRDASAPDKPFLYCHARSPDAAPAGDVPAGPGAPYAGLFSSRTLEVAGRQWEIQCVPLPDWLAKHRAWLSWTVLAGGLLLTGLLSAYFVVSIGRTAKIHRLAAQLMEANGNLESANRRLAELATTDELTGLWNRRRFVELLAAEVERSRRYGANLALMMVDIDQFKSINDTCGHAFGDRVLVEVARLLRREARETDVVARYAGDEFMVLMPCTSAEKAVSAAERTRKKTAERHISDDTRCVRVTISTGIGALGPGPASTPEGLVRAADQALYVAKHSGRDCVRTWKQVASDEAAQAGTESEAVEDLRRKVARLSRRSRRLFMNRIRGLVNTMEARDPYAKSHSRNVARLAVGIARTLKLGRRQVASIHRAALIHDIGKIGVPDGILWKPGTLTPEERRVMQQHVLVGVHILGQMRFLESEIPIVRHHHERFDGHGYPDSISGEAIPLGARILAAADAFDAITGNRPYRTARELPQALRILIEESGHQFAPGVVDGLVQWVRATGHALGKHGTLTVEDLLASRLETAKVS